MGGHFTKGLAIDSHHHIGYKLRAASVREFSGDDLVRSMDANGIDVTVAMHFVAALRTADDFRAANDYVAAARAAHPNRIAGVGVVHPLLADAGIAEVERCHDLGFKAVKLHPIAHGYYNLDADVEPLVRLAGELELPVIIHSDFAHHICSPYAIAALARRVPDTTIVLLHLGMQPAMCHLVPDIVEAEPNVIVDTSQTCDKPDEVYGRPVEVLGADRVMFGSDGPECDVSVNLRKLEAAVERGALTRQAAEILLGETAGTVFGLRSPAPGTKVAR